MTLGARIKSIFGNSASARPNAWSSGITNTQSTRAELDAAMLGLVYRCLRKRAQALVDTDFIIGQQISQTETKALDVDHWLVKLLNNPNNEHDSIELFRLTQMWFDINGNAFWLCTIDDLGLPSQIHIIPPPNVTIQFNNGEVIGYKVRMGSVEEFVPAVQMIHFRNLEPSLRADKYYLGRSLVSTAVHEINIEEESKEFMRRYFANDAQPPLILETPNEIDEAEWQNFKARWDMRIRNYKLQAVLSGGMKLGVPPSVGLDIKGVSEDIRISLCALFGTPWSYISGDYAGGLNASTQSVKDTFNIDEMEPIRKYYASVLTRFFRQYEQALKVEHVPYAYRDPEENRKQIEFELGNGLATINEILQREGKEPIGPNGDVRFIASGMANLDAVVHPTPPPMLAQYEAKQYAEQSKYWTRTVMSAMKLESKIMRKMEPVFKEMRDEFSNRINKTKKAKTALHKTSSTAKVAIELFNDPIWTKKLQSAVRDIIKEYSKSTVEQILSDTNYSGVVPETLDTQIEGVINDSLKRFKSIPETIGNELAAKMADTTGMSALDMEDLIDDTFARYKVDSPYAERIAVTVTTQVTAGTQRATFDGLGYTSIWVSQRDGLVRDTHDAADGTKPDASGYFAVGDDRMKHPGGGSLPEENINCRCYLFPSIK